MEYLEILDGQGRKRHVKLDRARYLIGREASCDICLAHPNVSRRHAQLQRSDKGLWLLQDLNSLNHIYFNESPVQQIVLEPNRHIRISEFRLILHQAHSGPDFAALPPADDSAPSWPGLEPGWLEQLQSFQRILLRLDEPTPVLQQLAESFHRLARPMAVAVGLTSPDGYTWPVVHGSQQGCFDESLQMAGEKVGSSDSDVQAWYNGFDPDQTPNPSTPYCMLFPMKGRSGTIGHVYVHRPKVLPMPPALQRYLSLYANYAGLLYENLQVVQLRSQQKAMEAELHQARQIQIELFPATFEVDPRLQSFAVNLPSVHVSGDYYDLYRTGPETVAFVIADAMGHGMPAALMMASVRATLRMGLSLGLPWDALFKGVDSIIAQARVTSFVTGLIGQVDLEANELQLVIAGHHPPSILIDGQPVEVPDDCRTRPWALDFDSEWQVGRIPLGTGTWSVLCYTDGVIDTVIRPHEQFGAARVAKFHRDNYNDTAEDLCQGLLSAVAGASQSTSLADDQTVLVLRSS